MEPTPREAPMLPLREQAPDIRIENLSRQMEILSSKLDTVTSKLDAIGHKLDVMYRVVMGGSRYQ
jgi:hypothetical protein